MAYHSEELFRFAYFPKYHEQIEYLADNLAATEKWDFSDIRTKACKSLFLHHF